MKTIMTKLYTTDEYFPDYDVIGVLPVTQALYDRLAAYQDAYEQARDVIGSNMSTIDINDTSMKPVRVDTIVGVQRGVAEAFLEDGHATWEIASDAINGTLGNDAVDVSEVQCFGTYFVWRIGIDDTNVYLETPDLSLDDIRQALEGAKGAI
jgi:hypothetical protein